MRSTAVTIRPVTEDDWHEFRSLRLEMLADTPIAYGETLETALRHQEPEWKMRARRGTDHASALYVAIDDATGAWVGTMGGYMPRTGHPLLVGVYVAPTHRGSAAGVTEMLLGAIESWARGYGSVLALHVHEDNTRAIRFYERHGFTPTGRTLEYELAPGGLENEMVKPL